jgi:hypothetical protein
MGMVCCIEFDHLATSSLAGCPSRPWTGPRLARKFTMNAWRAPGEELGEMSIMGGCECQA